MNVLVTGATGFLGKYILSELEDRGISFRALSRSPKDDPNFVQCNILTDDLEDAFVGIDAVIHAAGLVSHDEKDTDRVWKIHVEGTKRILEAAAQAKVARVVYLSTSGTIAVSTEATQANEHSDSPFGLIKSWPYYRSKYFAEQIALDYAAKGLPLICLNPSLLLGPGEEAGGSSTKAVQLFLDDKIQVAPSGGVSFADVRDVAKTTVESLQYGHSGERYLLSSSNMTFLEFYQRIARLSCKSQPLFKMPTFTRTALNWVPKIKKIGMHLERHDVELASYFWYADSSRAIQDLHWKSRDPMETLYDTVEHLNNSQSEFAWFE